MGSWNETCGLTSLPLDEGDEVRFMIIRKVRRRKDDNAVFYPFDIFQPVSCLVKGTYDDYGIVGLSDTEKDRLFKSLMDCNIEFPETEMHGHFHVNDIEYDLHVDHYKWFIREDAFQMLNDLPLRDDTKTLGAAQKETRKKVLAAIDEISAKSAIFGALTGGYEISQIFGRLEMPHPPIFPVLNEAIMSSFSAISKEKADEILNNTSTTGEKVDFNAILAAFPKPDKSKTPEAIDHMLDITRILYGMLTLRKMLHPMGGAGSQAWNDTAYEVYGKFVEKTASDHRKRIGSYDD